MKLSKIFHTLSVIVGFAGIIFLLAAWNAGENGTALGFTQAHLFSDATILVLIAIWIQIAAIHHMKLEKEIRQ